MPEHEVGRALISVLGQTKVESDGIVRRMRGSVARVLCHLAVRRGSRVDTESLIAVLWSEPPTSARTSLQVAVHKLRAAVEPERRKGEPPTIVKHADGGYWLDLDSCALDIELLHSGLQIARTLARAGRWEQTSTTLESALSLWGEPFGALGNEPGLFEESEHLREVKREAEELLSETRLQLREYCMVRLRDLARKEPLREKRWEHLIRGLYAEGRRAEAIRGFNEAAQALAQVGLDLGPRLRQLEDEVLAGRHLSAWTTRS